MFAMGVLSIRLVDLSPKKGVCRWEVNNVDVPGLRSDFHLVHRVKKFSAPRARQHWNFL